MWDELSEDDDEDEQTDTGKDTNQEHLKTLKDKNSGESGDSGEGYEQERIVKGTGYPIDAQGEEGHDNGVHDLQDDDDDDDDGSEGEEITYVALRSYEAREEGELSFKEGDDVVVFSEHGDWWYGRINGVEGRLRASYVGVKM